MQMPTKTELENLKKTWAIYRASIKPGSGAMARQQAVLYAKYTKALEKVLVKLGSHRLSDENQAALDIAADKWLSKQGMQGAGKWW